MVTLCLLAEADALLGGGRSRDRDRHRNLARFDMLPVRKSYRPYRNRAIIYAFTESGMRRGGVNNILLSDVDFKRRKVKTLEKGSTEKNYLISKQGIAAIQDYVEKERSQDADRWNSDVLFLAHSGALPNAQNNGKMGLKAINEIWNKVRDQAGLPPDKTPHSARHAMGKHIMNKTGNPKAVQEGLQHTSVISSMPYTNPTEDERRAVLEDR